MSGIERWKVILADDEPIIREGIRDSVDWDAHGMAVVAEAEDGEEALELAMHHEPHVMLVDLNMPIMNGIQLIQALKERLPDCRIVIVTGHDEFSYAQQAIRYGVEDYILKPANAAQLNELMHKLARALTETHQQEKHLRIASSQIRRNIPLLRERFCNEWVEEAVMLGTIEEQLRFLELPDAAPTLVGIIRWPDADLGQSIRSERDRQLLLFAIENIAAELAGDYPIVLFRDSLGFTCAIVWETTDASLFDDIEQAAARYLKIHVVTGAEHVEGMEGVAAAYRSARAAVYKETTVSPLVRRARQYVRDRYDDPALSLEATASAIGVSTVYLSRLFKQELGTTFVTLLTQTRIAKAIQLLAITNRSIADIADAVGYESQHYFSTAFKKVVGVSPIRYRKGDAGDEKDE